MINHRGLTQTMMIEILKYAGPTKCVLAEVKNLPNYIVNIND